MSNHDNEALSELTTRLHQQYCELSKIVDSIDEQTLGSVDAIGVQLKTIKETEDELAPMRAEFTRSGMRLSPAMQSATDETIELLKTLLPKLAQLEKSTIESAQRLFPQVRRGVRALQMQNAYAAGRNR